MDTREFLNAVLPAGGAYIVAVRDGDRLRHKGFYTIEEAADFCKAADSRGAETYHACAAYKQKPYKDPETGKFINRKQENWRAAKAFWCDIDCGAAKAAEGKGYPTQKDGALAILKWCKDKGLPFPMLINSGNGVHAYWCLAGEITPKEWYQAASILKKLLESAGVLADPSRTSDFASILRPVGTHNHKDPSNPKEVKLARAQAEPIEPADFIARLMTIYAEEGAGDLPPPPPWLQAAEGDAVPQFSTPTECDIDLCAEQCAQIRAMRDTKGDVPYDVWRGVIGVIKHSTSGIEKAREWSARRGETGHTNLDVDTRFNTWDSGPTTCEFFEKCNPAGCENCPFKGKVKTPWKLGCRLPEPEVDKTEVVVEGDSTKTKVTVEVPELPHGYIWDAKRGFMCREVKNKDGIVEAHAFSHTRFYLIDRIRNEEGKYEYVARAHLPKGILREFRIAGSIIGKGGGSLLEALASYEILTTNDKNAGLDMTAYIKDAVGKLMQDRAITSTHTCFGWQEGGKFLLGTRLYSPNGEITEALLSGYASDQRKCFPRPTGTLDGYSENLNWIFNREGMEPLQYMICSMWGSVLVDFAEPMYKGIPVAVTGAQSGKGKTTAGMAALYAFGDANELTVSGKQGATVKARAALLGAVQNIPVLFDEVTNMAPTGLSELCYALSNGQEVLRLQASGGGGVKFANRETWRLQSALTGNTNICARLSANGNSDAEAMRVFEITIDRYPIPMLDPVAVSQRMAEISKNVGLAGEAFVRYVVMNRNNVISYMQSALDAEGMKESALMTQPKFRFYRNHIACTIAAALIMKELGIIKFDVERLRKFAVDAVEDLMETTAELNAFDYDTALERMLSDFGSQIITTPSYPLSHQRGTSIFQVSPGIKTLLGRAIRPPEPTGTPLDDKLLLSAGAVRDWCVEHRVDTTAFYNDLAEKEIAIANDGRYSLGKATTFTTKQCRCWILDLNKLEG